MNCACLSEEKLDTAPNSRLSNLTQRWRTRRPSKWSQNETCCVSDVLWCCVCRLVFKAAAEHSAGGFTLLSAAHYYYYYYYHRWQRLQWKCLQLSLQVMFVFLWDDDVTVREWFQDQERERETVWRRDVQGLSGQINTHQTQTDALNGRLVESSVFLSTVFYFGILVYWLQVLEDKSQVQFQGLEGKPSLKSFNRDKPWVLMC